MSIMLIFWVEVVYTFPCVKNTSMAFFCCFNIAAKNISDSKEKLHRRQNIKLCEPRPLIRTGVTLVHPHLHRQRPEPFADEKEAVCAQQEDFVQIKVFFLSNELYVYISCDTLVNIFCVFLKDCYFYNYQKFLVIFSFCNNRLSCFSNNIFST